MAGICKHSVSLHKTRICLQQPADKAAIDSLEAALNDQYMSHHDHKTIARSDSFGVFIATQVFNWSETDGYLHASDPYTPPTGPGLWVPTPPAYAPAQEPYWGNLRPIIAGSIDNTQPGPPIPYSETKGSDFYKMVNHVHWVSKHLTHADSIQVLFWRDIPGYTTAGHWLSILQQVLKQENTPLDKAALAYALTGAALNDASISVWQTKYHYNLVRPITYIQNVIGDATWLSLLTTPAHPEYSSAHCVISTATTQMFLAIFGNIGSFTDHSYDYLGLGPRTFNHFIDIPEDIAQARVLGGIHYRPSCDTGMVQGRKVAANIIRIFNLH